MYLTIVLPARIIQQEISSQSLQRITSLLFLQTANSVTWDEHIQRKQWNTASGQKEGAATGSPVGKLQIHSLFCHAQSRTSFHLFFRTLHVIEVTFLQKLFEK